MMSSNFVESDLKKNESRALKKPLFFGIQKKIITFLIFYSEVQKI
jgi:hypothetical protein